MKTFRVLLGLILTIAIFLTSFSVSVARSWGPNVGQPQDLTISQMHQMLAQRKAESLERARELERTRERTALSSQVSYDVTFYDIDIRVNDTTEILYGHVRMVAEAVEDNVVDLDFDLYSNMTIDSISSPGGILSWSRSGHVITVTLDQTYNTGETIDLTVWYYGHPTEGGFQAFSFDSHGGKKMISSLSEPYFARTWWPCKDRMDDKPDSVDIAMEVDTAFWVASNGLLDSIATPGGNSHKFHWSVRYPIVTYLVAVSIYDYTVWEQDYPYNSDLDTMLIVHAVYPDQYSTSLTSWGNTPTILDELADAFGPYPFLDEKYGHANFEWGGGMEHQTMTSMTGSWFGFYEPVIIHEATHQWWGDMITCESWDDIWLNEGWASYGEAVYYLGTEGWSSYHSYMAGMRYTGGGTVWVDDTTSVGRIFHGGLSYDKGAWVVHMLRGVLGEYLWSVGIDAWYNSEYQHKAATTEKFKNTWEASTGVELDWFFEDWIYNSYFPNYNWFWMTEPAEGGGYDIYVMIKQTQTVTSHIYRMPVDMFFDYSSITDDTLVLVADQQKNFFKFYSTSNVTAMDLDPRNWILQSNSERPWEMFIITLDEELSDGLEFVPYVDTIEFRGGIGTVDVSISSGSLPPGLSIDNNGVLSGTPTDTGSFSFVALFEDTFVGSYTDSVAYTMYIGEYTGCCLGGRGDIHLEGDCGPSDQVVDVADLTDLIDHLFINFTPLCCAEEADLGPTGSLDSVVDVIDLTAMIDHLFIEFPALPSCF